MLLVLIRRLFHRTPSGGNASLVGFFESPAGVMVLSFMVGVALSTLFVDLCDGVSCVEFRGPIVSRVDGKIFVYRDRGGANRCAKTDFVPAECDIRRRIVPFASSADDRAQPANETFPTTILEPSVPGLAVPHPTTAL